MDGGVRQNSFRRLANAPSKFRFLTRNKHYSDDWAGHDNGEVFEIGIVKNF